MAPGNAQIFSGRFLRARLSALIRWRQPALIAETGYPLVAKPDIGVGAAATYKIHDEKELKAFFESRPTVASSGPAVLPS